MNSRRVSTIFLLTLLGVTFVLAYGILRPFLHPVVLAMVIGIGFHPLHIQIQRLVRRNNVATLISTAAVFLIFVIPAGILASAASRELIHTAHYISSKSAAEGGIVSYVNQSVDRILEWLRKYVDVESSGIRQIVDSLPANVSKFLLRTGTLLVAGLANFAGQGVITLFILFFVFRDGPSIMDQVASVLPLDTERARHLIARMRESIVANLYGIVAVSIVQGLLTWIAMTIVRAGSPLLLGVAAAMFSLVPIVGSALVWVPVALVQLLTGHWWKATFLVIWGTVVAGAADNVVRPLVVGGRVKLHPVLVLFSLIGGVKQFGFIGLFVGPVVISLLLALLNLLKEEFGQTTNGALVTDAAKVPSMRPE